MEEDLGVKVILVKRCGGHGVCGDGNDCVGG